MPCYAITECHLPEICRKGSATGNIRNLLAWRVRCGGTDLKESRVDIRGLIKRERVFRIPAPLLKWLCGSRRPAGFAIHLIGRLFLQQGPSNASIELGQATHALLSFNKDR